MDELRQDDWVFLKIYVGANPGAMDFFITDVIPDVLAPGGFDRWFFLRFADEAGLHVRLRLRAQPGEAAKLQRSVMLACNRGLDRLGTLPLYDYRPLVLLPGGQDRTWLEKNPVAVRAATYEPEVEKYGGEPGIPIAEELFELSSKLAVAALRADREGTCSRKTLAPCLMAAAAKVFVPSDPARFWSDYALHWLGGDSTFARDWRERFLAQAEVLRGRNTAVVVSRDSLAAEANTVLADWDDALGIAFGKYRRMKAFQEFPSAKLGFHFIHTMNNRLGLHMLEEAYLGTMLELCASGALPS